MSELRYLRAWDGADDEARFEAAAADSFAFGSLGRPDGIPAVSAKPTQAATEVLVQFRAGASAADQALAISNAGGSTASVLRSAGDGDLLLICVAPGRSAEAVIEALSHNPNVAFAEVNATLAVQGSNDTRYTNGGLWGMYGDTTTPSNQFGSQAGEAWARGYTGSTKTVIGVIDTGIDYTHADLYLNIWLNPGEIPNNLGLVDTDGDTLITFRDLNHSSNTHAVSDKNGNGRIDAGDLLNDTRWENGIDNDNNGRVDDLIGWDFVNNDNDPMDGNGHGTHVAGTIGAIGNNALGVAGVNWAVQLVALKFLPDSGSGTSAAAISAIDYYTNAAKAHDAGAGNYVGTNNSWGGTSSSQSMLDAIVRAAKQDLLFVAAAGNGGSDGVGDNNDVTGYFPTNYSTLAAAGWEAVVAVANITSTGARAGSSNYGKTAVDLGAPGSSIVSTTPGGNYAAYTGTSMAAPHVAGALGLLSAYAEGLTGAQLRAALLASAEATTSLTNITVTGGRLDVNELITTGLGGAPAPSPTPTPSPTPSPSPTPTPSPDQLIYGTDASESLTGGSGNDTISGVPLNSTTLGSRTVDVLTGGAGNDMFILGDARGVFYDDGRSNNQGYGDYARITDFAEGDRIQLAPGTYFLSAGSVGGFSGMRIFHDTNGSGSFDGRDEFIALVQGSKTLTMADIVFSAAAPTPAPSPSPSPSPSPTTNIYGIDSSETLYGTTGNDMISGVPLISTNLGTGRIDTLIGKGGDDLFILGDARGVFYNDNRADNQGYGDYALVTDFSQGDRIQLAAGTYFLRAVSGSTVNEVRIFHDSNGNGIYDGFDEHVGRTQGSKLLTASDIVFVSAGSSTAAASTAIAIDITGSEAGAFAATDFTSLFSTDHSGWFGDAGFQPLVLAELQQTGLMIA